MLIQDEILCSPIATMEALQWPIISEREGWL
jgi:hypothetical protein